MGHNSVKSSNVIEAELPQRTLKNFNSPFFRRFVGRCRVDRFYNLVNLGGDKGIWVWYVSIQFNDV